MVTNQDYFMTGKVLGFHCWRDDVFELVPGKWGDLRETHFIVARGQLIAAQLQQMLRKK